MENLTGFSEYKVDDSYTKHGLMVEKEFFIFNKPIISKTSSIWNPQTDVFETDDDIIVKMEISGAKAKDIKISFAENVLNVSGKRPDNLQHIKTSFHQVEIRYGYFERRIMIPKLINRERIRASYSDGFLMVVCPKTGQITTSSK